METVGTSERKKKNQREGSSLRVECNVFRYFPCYSVSSSKPCEKDILVFPVLLNELKLGKVKKTGQDPKTRNSRARI